MTKCPNDGLECIYTTARSCPIAYNTNRVKHIKFRCLLEHPTHKEVDTSEEATRTRVRSYTNVQLQALHDTLQLAFKPNNEPDKKYLEVLRDETTKELKKRGLWLGW